MLSIKKQMVYDIIDHKWIPVISVNGRNYRSFHEIWWDESRMLLSLLIFRYLFLSDRWKLYLFTFMWLGSIPKGLYYFFKNIDRILITEHSDALWIETESRKSAEFRLVFGIRSKRPSFTVDYPLQLIYRTRICGYPFKGLCKPVLIDFNDWICKHLIKTDK